VKYLLISVLSFFLFLGCSSKKNVKEQTNKTKVVKPKADSLSDSDFKKISSLSTEKILGAKLKSESGEIPNIKILDMKSTTSMIISESYIKDSISRKLINSGEVSVLMSGDLALEVKSEGASSDLTKADFVMKSSMIEVSTENRYFYTVEIFDKTNKSVLNFKVLVDKKSNKVALVK